jgi:hypothetical protein
MIRRFFTARSSNSSSVGVAGPVAAGVGVEVGAGAGVGVRVIQQMLVCQQMLVWQWEPKRQQWCSSECQTCLISFAVLVLLG